MLWYNEGFQTNALDSTSAIISPGENYLYNFRPLEVVSRYRDPQLQVGENYKLRQICRYCLPCKASSRSFLLYTTF